MEQFCPPPPKKPPRHNLILEEIKFGSIYIQASCKMKTCFINPAVYFETAGHTFWPIFHLYSEYFAIIVLTVACPMVYGAEWCSRGCELA